MSYYCSAVHRRWPPAALLILALPVAAWADSPVSADETPPPQAAAQSAANGSASSTLEEVVVTARSRKENVENVPDTITVFSADQIQSDRIQDVFGFTRLTPGVSLVEPSESPGIALINIRGIGQQLTSDAPVAVVVDGVQTTSTAAITQRLYDVEQIEVLKGPQGALYGRNALGGAIIITTPTPTNDFSASVLAGGGTHGYWDTVLTASGPVVADKVLFRLAASDSDYNGDFRNSTTGRYTNPLRDRDVQGRLLIKPADDLTFDVRSSYSETRNAGYNGVIIPDGEIDNFSLRPESGQTGSGYRHVYEGAVRAALNTSLGEFSSTTSYTNTLDESSYDLGSLPVPSAFLSPQSTRVGAASEDFRLTSPSDQRLRYVVGAYYLYSTEDRFINFDVYPLFFSLLGFPPSALPPGPVGMITTNTHDTLHSWAGFGQLNYDLTQRVELTAAFRYDSNSVKQLDNLAQTTTQADFSKPQPKVSLNYRPGGDVDLYATVGQGFRNGGFNAPGPTFPTIYDSETTTNYEAGFKSQLWSRRVQVNGAVFHTLYDNEQVTLVDIENTGSQGIVNIPESVINGAELEAQALVVGGLRLSAGVSYVHSKITSFPQAPQYLGNRTPYTPEYTFNVGADYAWPLLDGWQGTLHVDYAGQAGMYYDYFNSAEQKTYGLTNLRASLDKRGWRFSLFGENLFNVPYYADYTSKILTAPFNLNYGIRGQGQHLGAELSYRF